MVGRFKSNAPINNFILFVYALFVKWPLFYHPQLPVASNDDGYLYRKTISILLVAGQFAPFLFGILAFLLFFTQALLLNQIFINQKLFQKPNHLAGMSFILFSSLIHDFSYFNPTLIGCTFSVWILYKFVMLQPTQDSKKVVFDIGMLFGLAFLFYSPVFIFAFLIFYGLSVMRPFRLTEWILPVLGMITPFYFLWSINFISDNDKTFIFPGIKIGIPHFAFSKFEIIAIVMAALCLLIGFVFVQNNMRRLLVQSRKSWALIYFFFFLSIVVLFQKTSHGNSIMLLMAIPASCIASAGFFYPDKKWFPALMHWAMFALSAVIGYYSF